MSIFTRFKDIVNSNINALLDKAEDPEKMIRLMIQEMEDTLVEFKSSCASKMASLTRVRKQMSETESVVTRWQNRAMMAVEKGRDDLAREALIEKKRVSETIEGMKKEAELLEKNIDEAKDEIRQIENKLQNVKMQYKTMKEKERRAREERDAQTILRSDASDRFSDLEERIGRMNAYTDLDRKSDDLEKQFADIEDMDEIEKELEELKRGL